MQMVRFRTAMVGTAMVITPCNFAGADEIVLHSAVRLDGERAAVRLSDIAALEGAEAFRYADLVVAEPADPTSVQEIPLHVVRAKLDEAGVHWGRVNLSGSQVVLRPYRSAHAAPPMAMSALTIGPEPAPDSSNEARTPGAQLASELADASTLRGAVAQFIATAMRLAPDRVRLDFGGTDQSLLDLSLTDARFEIEPLGSIFSDRIELAVRLWAEGRVQARHSVTVRPMIETRVASLTQDVPRGHGIDASAITAQTMWLTPTQAGQIVAPAEAIGQAAAQHLKSGEMLRMQHLRPAIAIRRGERAMVRCLVGGVVIAVQAEAGEDGAAGQTIEFRKIGERETFAATVSGPGEAAIDFSR